MAQVFLLRLILLPGQWPVATALSPINMPNLGPTAREKTKIPNAETDIQKGAPGGGRAEQNAQKSQTTPSHRASNQN